MFGGKMRQYHFIGLSDDMFIKMRPFSLMATLRKRLCCIK